MKRSEKDSTNKAHSTPARNIPIVYRSGTVLPSIEQSSPTTAPNSWTERATCFICATEHPKFWAIFECSHRICSLCALRLCHLYKNHKCVWCKVESERIVVIPSTREFFPSNTTDGDGERTRSFDELFYPGNHLISGEGHLAGFYFDEEKARREMASVLCLTCNVPGCRQKAEFPNLTELKFHVQNAHQLVLCDICLAHKKTFPSEYRYYRRVDLGRHQKGELDGRGHPSCTLCGTLFYSEDELAEHYRQRHEICFICQRRPTLGEEPSAAKPPNRSANSNTAVHYRDYSELEAHFRRSHFLCPDPMCLELKFVVFATEMEYKAHMAQVHLSHVKMQRSTQRQMVRLDAGFTFSNQNNTNDTNSTNNNDSPSSSERRDRRQRGRERRVEAPNLEPAITSTDSPSTSLPTRVLSHLIYGDTISELAQKLQSLSLYEERNEELCNRLCREFGFSREKLDFFKALCRQFQQSKISAPQMVLRLEDIMSGSVGVEAISKELIDLQLDSMKRRELDQAISNYLRRLREFPSLPITSSPASAIAKGPTIRESLSLKPVSTIRIRPANNTIAQNRGIDPSRNPMALLGATKTTASLRPSIVTTTLAGTADGQSNTKKKQKQPLPSFTQVISTSSSVGVTRGDDNSPTRALDERQFPLLVPPVSTSPKSSDGNQGHVFARLRDAYEPESFIVGGTQHDHNDKDGKDDGMETPDSSTLSSGKTRKKKERTVLIKYG